MWHILLTQLLIRNISLKVFQWHSILDFVVFDSLRLFYSKSLVLGPKFSSVAQLCQTLCGPVDCSMPSFPVCHQLPELTQTHVHWVGDAIQPSHLCHPLLLPPSIFPSIRVFSNESVLHIRWPYISKLNLEKKKKQKPLFGYTIIKGTVDFILKQTYDYNKDSKDGILRKFCINTIFPFLYQEGAVYILSLYWLIYLNSATS